MYKYYSNRIKEDYKFLIDYCKVRKNSISFKKRYKKSKMPFINVKVNNKKYTFLLDSGCSKSVIDYNVLEKLGIKEEDLIAEKGGVLVGSGDILASKSIDILIHVKGKHVLQNFITYDVSLVMEDLSKDTNSNVIGILGTDFFETQRWLLDFNKLVVWIP